MKEEAAVGPQKFSSPYKAGLKESQVVIENVRIGPGAQLDGFIALPLKSGSIPFRVSNRPYRQASLNLSSVERRININTIYRRGGETRKNGEIVFEINCELGHYPSSVVLHAERFP
jgi:hypothetical protein